MCGPVSTEFQFQDVADGQLVHPLWCFVIKVTYLQNNTSSNAWQYTVLIVSNRVEPLQFADTLEIT